MQLAFIPSQINENEKTVVKSISHYTLAAKAGRFQTLSV
jgi:hypothetical protein